MDLRLSLEERMDQQVYLLSDGELSAIAHELEEQVFNEGQAEKISHKYRDYLYRAERAAKDHALTSEQYLTTSCFYLFTVPQLGLPFLEEKVRFWKALAREYENHKPRIVISISEDEEDLEDALPAVISQEELKRNDLFIMPKQRIQDEIGRYAVRALDRLERAWKTNDRLRERLADAYGHVKVTPLYIGCDSSSLLKRYETLRHGAVIGLTAPEFSEREKKK